MFKVPLIGQLTNAILAKKLVDVRYKYSLPKNHESKHEYSHTAKTSITNGGCFCLSSLVQGLKKDRKSKLNLIGIPTSLVWGSMDFTHRKTNKYYIKNI
jgi:hypothetical protein